MHETVRVLDMETDLVSLPEVTDTVLTWARNRESRYVCVANVHMCMECVDHPSFRKVVNDADLTVPDGRPLVWMQYLLGYHHAQQVRGSDLVRALCTAAEKSGVSVGFYGGAPEVLDRFVAVLNTRFPNLQIAFCHAPPFRPLSEEELAADVERINNSGVDILFVGLGCPKQERWMAQQKGSVQAVMLGVGAAFDFLAGVKPHAPRWIQVAGLEWLFRLMCEPKRLWRRYLLLNPRFILLAGKQLIYERF